MNERRSTVLLWTIFVILVALLFVFGMGWADGQEAPRRASGRLAPGPDSTATPTPTITPTPDPCAACPDPDGFSCQMWPVMCYACWEQCGRPIATPTPTRTPTRTKTPTPPPPTPTPTPNGPPCALHATKGENVYLIAFYAHESPTLGKRYTFTTPAMWIPAGYQANPCPCEGRPIGFEWRIAATDELLLGCGDTSHVYPRSPTPTPTPPPFELFRDGFESGDTGRWSAAVGGA